MNNGIEELAVMFHERENPPEYAPVYGIVESLPDIKIRRGSKIVIKARQIKSLINLRETDADGGYVCLGKQVAMLPYKDNNRYLVLGVVYNG